VSTDGDRERESHVRSPRSQVSCNFFWDAARADFSGSQRQGEGNGEKKREGRAHQKNHQPPASSIEKAASKLAARNLVKTLAGQGRELRAEAAKGEKGRVCGDPVCKSLSESFVFDRKTPLNANRTIRRAEKHIRVRATLSNDRLCRRPSRGNDWDNS